MRNKLLNDFIFNSQNLRRSVTDFLGEVGNVQVRFPHELITEIHDIAQRNILKVALYDYNPPEQSPNEEPQLELSFLTGDILHICE